jgi:hypothetical protein
MRKFWLRAALAASLLRDLFLACGAGVAWPFLWAARRCDALAQAFPRNAVWPWWDFPRRRRGAARETPLSMSAAARDVLAERRRQIEVEGWTPEHDDSHAAGALASAAACYAIGSMIEIPLVHRGSAVMNGNGKPFVSRIWPFAAHWWKPKSRRYDLVRAGALIQAEIERLDRAAQK